MGRDGLVYIAKEPSFRERKFFFSNFERYFDKTLYKIDTVD